MVGVMILYIVAVAFVTLWYVYVKIYPSLHLRSVHFTMCKLYFQYTLFLVKQRVGI